MTFLSSRAVLWTACLAGFLSTDARSQCISIDFDNAAGTPPIGFSGAAMLPSGHWNFVEGSDLSKPLIDSHGVSTGASFVQLSPVATGAPATCSSWASGTPAHPLMADGFRVGNGIELRIEGLASGEYEVLFYGFSSILGSSGICVELNAGSPSQALLSTALCSTSSDPFIAGLTYSQQTLVIDRTDASSLNDELVAWIDDCQPNGSGHRVMGMEVRRLTSPAAVGVNYCVGAVNSTGMGGRIGATATLAVACDSNPAPSIPANDLLLRASSLPAFQPGYFYYGPTQLLIPFEDGFRCVGAGSTGTARLPITAADANGVMTTLVDYTTPPTAATQITAGSTWNIQCWYRDPGFGNHGTNLTDALEVQF